MLLLLLHFLVYPIWPPSMDLIIREPRERKVSIFMLCIHTETEPLREKLGERREFCLSGKCRNYLKKLNVHKHSPTHRKYFFLSITVRNNCFFLRVSVCSLYTGQRRRQSAVETSIYKQLSFVPSSDKDSRRKSIRRNIHPTTSYDNWCYLLR